MKVYFLSQVGMVERVPSPFLDVTVYIVLSYLQCLFDYSLKESWIACAFARTENELVNVNLFLALCTSGYYAFSFSYAQEHAISCGNITPLPGDFSTMLPTWLFVEFSNSSITILL